MQTESDGRPEKKKEGMNYKTGYESYAREIYNVPQRLLVASNGKYRSLPIFLSRLLLLLLLNCG
jgi:hypothetical protein